MGQTRLSSVCRSFTLGTKRWKMLDISANAVAAGDDDNTRHRLAPAGFRSDSDPKIVDGFDAPAGAVIVANRA